MPVDMKRCPSNWPAIRRAILERAGHRCEQCGVENHAVGARDRFGDWHSEDEIDGMGRETGEWLFGTDVDFPKIIRIVLTIAHLSDPDPHAVDPSNLASLCQQCHNRLDAPMRARHAAETRRRKRLARTGQTEMVLEAVA